jgi:hypothetical protein
MSFLLASVALSNSSTYCTVYPGLTIGTQDLTHSNSVASAAACCDLCSSNAQCASWTWHDSTKGKGANTCWLKSDTVDSGRPKDTDNHTCSGLRLSPSPSPGPLPGPSPPAPVPSGEQKFFVFGDWGGRSERQPADDAQKAGAAGMTKVAQQIGGVDYIVSVGDHFYEGGIKGSAHDKRFKVTFEDVYHQKELQCPWCAHRESNSHPAYGPAARPACRSRD